MCSHDTKASEQFSDRLHGVPLLPHVLFNYRRLHLWRFIATMLMVFFRDPGHDLLAWALATFLIAVIVTPGSAATAGSGWTAAGLQPVTPPTPEVAEEARKIAVAFAFTTSLSLLIGAFIASAVGALGGFHRDKS